MLSYDRFPKPLPTNGTLSMTNTTVSRLVVTLALTSALGLVAWPAEAQYRPRPISDPATGESFHIEAAANFWRPGIAGLISSESLGIVGSRIDFKTDLGIEDKSFPEIRVVLRPARRHKLRFQYIPISYHSRAIALRKLVFNGIEYPVGVPVNSDIDWKAYRFSYEGDIVSRDRGFLGIVLDAKYTDIHAVLASPIDTERTHARAPIPSLGGIVRVYVAPNISITGELTGFTLGWLPKSVTKQDTGHYSDLDLYGTVNFTNNIGVQAGYRAFDVGYAINLDAGAMTLRGMYFGMAVRY
jgi:hypothetical protein